MTTRVCAIHQPNLFPRLSTLAKLHAADIWIVLDSVQFTARDYQHRAWLESTDSTHGQWLTAPVHRPRGRDTTLDQVRLADPALTAHRIASLLHHYYRTSPRWTQLQPLIEATAAAAAHTTNLTELTTLSTNLLLRHTGWTGEIIHATTIPTRSHRSERLADLTTHVNATHYLCGTGGATYLNPQPFTDAGLTIRYTHPPDIGILRTRRRATSLWWLAALTCQELNDLLWNQPKATITCPQ
ncbi:WbqC family protein [Actinokineospora bangkokensis]|uniref:WbqC family protein n=1 Tax=Actinokineospora bangkokensis TaxID=1193682 RepID=A0A1Q9LKL6_9PSEU|nr:WbqC family protein [Actinokineospora bangkokensis]OLR92560.1 hypothetical protein BJP25_21110 [Actinokineospora bangkokensis]